MTSSRIFAVCCALLAALPVASARAEKEGYINLYKEISSNLPCRNLQTPTCSSGSPVKMSNGSCYIYKCPSDITEQEKNTIIREGCTEGDLCVDGVETVMSGGRVTKCSTPVAPTECNGRIVTTKGALGCPILVCSPFGTRLGKDSPQVCPDIVVPKYCTNNNLKIVTDKRGCEQYECAEEDNSIRSQWMRARRIDHESGHNRDY